MTTLLMLGACICIFLIIPPKFRFLVVLLVVALVLLCAAELLNAGYSLTIATNDTTLVLILIAFVFVSSLDFSNDSSPKTTSK